MNEPTDRFGFMDSETFTQDPSPMQEKLAEYVENILQDEITKNRKQRHLSSPRNIEIPDDASIPLGLRNSVVFQKAFHGLEQWESNNFRQMRIHGESIESPGTGFVVLTTPQKLQNKEWIIQSFSLHERDTGFALSCLNGHVKAKNERVTSGVIKEIGSALLGAYQSDALVPSTPWDRLISGKKREEQMLQTLLTNDADYRHIMGTMILTPDRFMTDDEMREWMELLQAMPTQPTQVYYSKVCKGFSFDYGLFLQDEMNGGVGKRKIGSSIIVPLHCLADGKSVWTTATLMSDGVNIAAVHFHHGKRHMAQMERSINPGLLFD